MNKILLLVSFGLLWSFSSSITSWSMQLFPSISTARSTEKIHWSTTSKINRSISSRFLFSYLHFIKAEATTHMFSQHDNRFKFEGDPLVRGTQAVSFHFLEREREIIGNSYLGFWQTKSSNKCSRWIRPIIRQLGTEKCRSKKFRRCN